VGNDLALLQIDIGKEKRRIDLGRSIGIQGNKRIIDTIDILAQELSISIQGNYVYSLVFCA